MMAESLDKKPQDDDSKDEMIEESLEQKIESARLRIDADMALLEELQRQHAEQSAASAQDQMDSLEAVAKAHSDAMSDRSRLIAQAVSAAMSPKPGAGRPRKTEAD